MLGLHLFGKEFRSVQRLVANKPISRVVRYYYDDFKYTIAYRRWREFSVRWGIKGEQFVSGRKQTKLLQGLLERGGQGPDQPALQSVQWQRCRGGVAPTA